MGLQRLVFCVLIGRASSESDQWELAFGHLRPDWSRILRVRPMGAGVWLCPPAWWLVGLSRLLPLSEGGGLCWFLWRICGDMIFDEVNLDLISVEDC